MSKTGTRIERALLFTMQESPLGEFYLSKSIYSAVLELAFICLNEEKKNLEIPCGFNDLSSNQTFLQKKTNKSDKIVSDNRGKTS